MLRLIGVLITLTLLGVIIWWQVGLMQQRLYSPLGDFVSPSFLQQAEEDYIRRMEEVRETYNPIMEEMTGKLTEEQEKLIAIEERVTELIEKGVTTKEEVMGMTKKEINLLIEENLKTIENDE